MGIKSFRVLQFPFISIFPPMAHTHLQINIVINIRTTGRRLRTFKQNSFYRIWGTFDRRVFFVVI